MRISLIIATSILWTMERIVRAENSIPTEGACRLKPKSGHPVSLYPGDVIRRYDDIANRCSSICLCKPDGKLDCLEIGCIGINADCDIDPEISMKYGEVRILPQRGTCTCILGEVVCQRLKGITKLDLPPGLYLFVGYSEREFLWLREKTPKTLLSLSGMAKSPRMAGKDISAQLQTAFVRLNPQEGNCQFGARLFAEYRNNVILNVETTDSIHPENVTWLSGGPEYKCTSAFERLLHDFQSNGSSRYQIVLSTIRHMELMENFPIQSNSVASHLGSICVFMFFVVKL